MQWARFLQDGQPVWGQVREGMIQAVAGSPLVVGHCPPQPGIERLPLAGTALLPPCEPSKIVCVGRNYRDHAQELGHAVPDPATMEPLLFLKPPSALLPPGGTILLPKLSRQVEHEGELGVVVRRRCAKLGAGEDIRPYILGLTCVNDVTARDLQKSDPQWTRAKGFDTFCPVGPVVAELSDGWDWNGLEIETRVNGEVRQRGNTRDFLFPLERIFAAITAVMTLEPGDLIATGTPAGVGPLRPGDTVTVTLAGLPALENTVAAG